MIDMSTRSKRYVIQLIVMLAIFVVFGMLLAAAMFFGTSDWRFQLFVRSETVYIILILAILIPAFMIVLTIGVHRRNKENANLPKHAVEDRKSVV